MPSLSRNYSLLQAKAIAGRAQKQNEALQFAAEAKAQFENPELRYEVETHMKSIQCLQF